jgi:predicted acyltransferase
MTQWTQRMGVAASHAPARGAEFSGASVRLRSLDVFRGVTIAAMLLVNNPGDWDAIYPALRHAEWHGWTPTDLVFPFFLFIVGVSMTFSFGNASARGVPRHSIFASAVRRALLLILIGVALHVAEWIGYNYAYLRIPGVLQRIGLTFLVATPIVLWVGWRGRAAIVTALLLGYWALLSWMPVPGSGVGVLEPGRDLGAFIDRAVFGAVHLSEEFQTTDPNNLLGTIPSTATVLLGVFAGEWIRLGRAASSTVLRMLAAGTIAAVLGTAWDPLFPINKPLWTSSYAIFTAGMATIGLSFCYWLIEIKRYRRWTFPFLVLGVNAIATYVLSALMTLALWKVPAPGSGSRQVMYMWIYETAYASWLSPVHASLAFALWYVGLWTVIMWGFHQKRLFIKL